MNMLENLKKYFATNSPEKIANDWSDTEVYDSVGPPVKMFMKQTQWFVEIGASALLWEQLSIYKQHENPNYSDFCILN